MAGARVALSSVPEKGISVDGVVAVLPSVSVLVRMKVKDGEYVLKGQAVALEANSHNVVSTTVDSESRVFMGIAHSSGTQHADHSPKIPVITVLRGPIGRGVMGEDLASAYWAIAGADGKFYAETVAANAHARVREVKVVGDSLEGTGANDYPYGELKAVDLEFWTIGK
jgi:hypothetical protein